MIEWNMPLSPVSSTRKKVELSFHNVIYDSFAFYSVWCVRWCMRTEVCCQLVSFSSVISFKRKLLIAELQFKRLNMAVVQCSFGIPLISASRTKCDLLTHAARDNKQKKKGSNKKTGMIPEPDYGDLEDVEGGKRHSSNGEIRFSEDGLVIPKKLQNPCKESSERQNLHRELLFNQKIGKSVIGQKTELHKAFDKFRDDQKKKELEEEKIHKKSALERKLEEQANKLKLQEELETKKIIETSDQPEFLRVHARVCAQTVDSKS